MVTPPGPVTLASCFTAQVCLLFVSWWATSPSAPAESLPVSVAEPVRVGCPTCPAAGFSALSLAVATTVAFFAGLGTGLLLLACCGPRIQTAAAAVVGVAAGAAVQRLGDTVGSVTDRSSPEPSPVSSPRAYDKPLLKRKESRFSDD